MRFGNCLIGLFLLALRHRFAGKTIIVRRPGQWVPHFLYRVDGRTYHYRKVRDVLPGPFRYFLFRGRFAPHRDQKS